MVTLLRLEFVVSVLFIGICCFSTFYWSLLFRYFLLEFVVSVLFIGICCLVLFIGVCYFGTFYWSLLFGTFFGVCSCGTSYRSLLFRYFLLEFVVSVLFIGVCCLVLFIHFYLCNLNCSFSLFILYFLFVRSHWVCVFWFP